MDILYIDSKMGISGIKLLSALVDMMEQPDAFVRQFNDLGFEGIRAELRSETSGAASGTRVEFQRVSSDDMYEDEEEEEEEGGFFSFGKRKTEHKPSRRKPTERTLDDIRDIIDDLPLSGKVRKRAIKIYERIAKSASKSHETPVEEVKLHRAGPKDVVASVVGVCMLLEEMSPDTIIGSPVTVGTGYVSATRGTIPVPTPTLKYILGDIPYVNGNEEGELCTLDGASILQEYVTEFSDMPEIAVLRSGVGIGIRKFKTGDNCVKVYAGEEVQTVANATVTELEAALFNDSAISLGFALEKLNAAGAVEAFTIPINLLSGGNGILLKCICPNECADEVAGEILKNTSATFVRRKAVSAYKVDISKEIIQTSIGDVALKKISGFGIERVDLEEEDVMKAARENNVSIRKAYDIIKKEI